MTKKTEITGITSFFIVRDIPVALIFYPYRLGFYIIFQRPCADNIFFGIVQRARR